MKTQIEFFTSVLGAELKALYWMHGVPGAWHGFLQLNEASYLAFVHTPEMVDIEPVFGLSHAGNPGLPAAGGTMQHVAFSVATEDELLAMRDRIRAHGVNVFGPLDHGMCKSIYFAGPEGLNLEVAWSAEGIDERAWIDPEVVALAGIDADELDRYLHPAPYAAAGAAGSVAQPPIDPAKSHAQYPEPVYRFLMETPDDVLTAQLSENTPPVAVPVPATG
jgi:catechol 2,3-dioxygenase-like lactoylglutathione lyase family enzyme